MAEFRTLTLWVLGYVLTSQVGVFAINRVANAHGGAHIFANADLLFQVPYGILGVSLLTALMPRMSRAAARGETSRVLDDLRLGTRLSAVALVPVSAALIVLGPSFTSVILLGRAQRVERPADRHRAGGRRLRAAAVRAGDAAATGVLRDAGRPHPDRDQPRHGGDQGGPGVTRPARCCTAGRSSSR